MKPDTVLFPLEFEPALAYVTEQLRDGSSLAQELLKSIDFKRGHFFSLLCSSADNSKIYDFQTGWILPPNPIEPVEFAGNTYPGRKKSNSFLQLAEYLKKNMQPTQCCYFEDMLYRKKDPAAAKFQANTLCYRDELYLFLTSEHFSLETTVKMINHTDAQWHYMNIVSEEGPGFSQDVTDEKLHRIVTGTSCIVVGAYDMEGFVVWEKLNRP